MSRSSSVSRAAGSPEELDQVADEGPSPSDQVAGKELLDRLRQALSDEERQLAELRGQGLSWSDIADRLGGTAQARRMQLARAVERVAHELGLEAADLYPLPCLPGRKILFPVCVSGADGDRREGVYS